MPVHNGSIDSFVDEYTDVFNELEAVLNISDCNHCIIGGDFNTSFTRDHISSRLLLNFITNHCLLSNLSLYNLEYTFESKANQARSVIDHIFCSDNLKDY